VTFLLRLRRDAVIEFTVFRIAPDCRLAGTFRVAAHAGVNRIRFRGRIGRRWLRPGTYLIRAQSVPANPTDTVLETRLVIFGSGKPTRRQVRAARAADVCPRPMFETIGLGFGSFLAAGAGGGPGASSPQSGSSGADSGRQGKAQEIKSGSVLGARFKAARDAARSVHPLIWIGFGIALALLVLAAWPIEAARNAKVAMLLAYRRTAVALAGAATLVLVTVAYVLS
jgi:hypothetical protein